MQGKDKNARCKGKTRMSETSEGQEWQLQGKDKNGRDNGNTRMPDTREVPECQQQVKDKNEMHQAKGKEAGGMKSTLDLRLTQDALPWR